MHAIKGYFDGKEIKPLEAMPIKGKAEVIITIIEPEDEWKEWLSLPENSFDFWNNPVDDETWNNA